jgi:hypothetical protein
MANFFAVNRQLTLAKHYDPLTPVVLAECNAKQFLDSSWFSDLRTPGTRFVFPIS